MILIDANLLLYAVNTDAPDHALAKPWVEDALQGVRGPIALSWFTLVAFVRVGTNPKALTSPFTLDQTIQIVGDWLRLPTVAIVGPGSHHFGHFEALCPSRSSLPA